MSTATAPRPRRARRGLFVLALCAACSRGVARADLVLETETAELGLRGLWGLSFGTQFERERDGSTTAFTLNQIEYAVTDHFEILIEPFFHEWDNPHGGEAFDGVGDLEITPSYMVVEDKGAVPAVVLAFKLKVPTARSRDIGTGEYDYQPYVIVGKKWGDWVFNANLGFDFVTSTRDEHLSNQLIYDFSVERRITEYWSVYAEVFGNSHAAPGENGTFAGAIATEYKFSEKFNVFISVGDDTDHLANVRVGFNIDF